MYLLEREFLKEALKEDIGRGDLFARISKSKRIKAYILAKSDGIFAGERYLMAAKEEFNIDVTLQKYDGEEFQKGEKLVYLQGDAKTLLSLERTLLNIILHASSIATLTNKYVQKIKPFNVVLLDTRKTRPKLRVLEKYAIRCGGGVNHRMGLDDCLMIKDTHLGAIDNLKEFIQEVRKKIPFTSKIEIECENFAIAKEAMEAGADIIMCDNMSIDEIKNVVKFRNENFKHILLEASGNITLDNIEAVAQTGIDAISTGSTIHQSTWIDLSMKVEGNEL